MIKKIENNTEMKIRKINILIRITTEETISLKETIRGTTMILIAIVTEIIDRMVQSTKGMRLDE